MFLTTQKLTAIPSSTHTARSWNLLPFLSHFGSTNIFSPSDTVSNGPRKNISGLA